MFKQICKIHLLVLLIFSLFRLILLFSNVNHWGAYSNDLIFKAMFMGLRFDFVISCYILALPTLCWGIIYIVGKNSKIINTILYFFCAIFFTIAFIISGLDIPYFNHFFSRFDRAAFLWVESPKFVFEMIIGDFSLWGYIFPFLILLIIFHYFLRKIFKEIRQLAFKNQVFVWKISLSLLIFLITFLGIRGRIEKKSPIRIGTAYFSNNAFFNKLGLNPNFTLVHSFLEKKKKWEPLLPIQEAILRTQQDLNILPSEEKNPIKQLITPDTLHFGKPNIVLVLMESMTANNLKYFGNAKTITPVLDSLIPKSIFFENAYSAGIHTFNGIFSSLYSFPALWDEHPLHRIVNYESSISAFAENGYATNFFINHDGQFDNVEGFLHFNHFQNVFSQKDYPTEKVQNDLGVADDFMFSFAVEKLNDLHKQKRPFFAAMMTATNHKPFVIPSYFQSKYANEKEEDKVIEYADWALGQFLKQAQAQAWFENTIFVFMADHGNASDNTYEMSLSYNHIPLLFYAPNLLKAEIRFDFALQMDAIPTLLGLTNLTYTKQNLGVNLWKQKRPFAYFGADDKIGILDNEFYLIYRKDKHTALYKYKEKDLTNYAEKYPEVVKKMTNYAFSHIETARAVSSTYK